jgi:hypothetical protein
MSSLSQVNSYVTDTCYLRRPEDAIRLGCVCVCVFLFNVRADHVIKSRVLKAPKGQRTPGEEGPRDSI